MIGCCKHPQATMRNSDGTPVLSLVQKYYPDVTSFEKRKIDLPRPHEKWVLISNDGEEPLCSCPCHKKFNTGFFC